MSTGLRFTLEVDGLPPDAFAVVSFHLNQSLSSLFSLDLSLVSQQFLSLEFAQVLDKMAYRSAQRPYHHRKTRSPRNRKK
ncbi:TPA: type VI secretion system Vgr family domain protein [Escherichia coli]|nr:type VI secretion system Vgr family domain protein [Escherichia coli]